jgi:hypothetical protein
VIVALRPLTCGDICDSSRGFSARPDERRPVDDLTESEGRRFGHPPRSAPTQVRVPFKPSATGEIPQRRIRLGHLASGPIIENPAVIRVAPMKIRCSVRSRQSRRGQMATAGGDTAVTARRGRSPSPVDRIPGGGGDRSRRSRTGLHRGTCRDLAVKVDWSGGKTDRMVAGLPKCGGRRNVRATAPGFGDRPAADPAQAGK